jgi:hypothetical protein
MNKITITWTWEDVQTLRDDWNKTQCQEALQSVSKALTSRSIEEGWQILEDLIFMNEGSYSWDKKEEKNEYQQTA